MAASVTADNTANDICPLNHISLHFCCCIYLYADPGSSVGTTHPFFHNHVPVICT